MVRASTWQFAHSTRYRAGTPPQTRIRVTQAKRADKPAPAAPDRAAPPAFLHHPRHHGDRRLCLAEGRQLAGGAARSRRCSTRISGTISRPRTTTPRACSATPRRCRRSWSRRCAGGSRRTIPACPRRTARSPISGSSARAASTKCSAARRATAARSRSCSTAMRWPQGPNTSSSAAARHSPDHRLQAWSADTKRLGIFLHPRARLGRPARTCDDLVEETDGGVVWGTDCNELLLRQARRQPPARCRSGVIGSARTQADDILVYEEKDSGWFTHLHESSRGRFCVIAGGDHETSEQRLIDLADPDAPPRLVAAREEGVQYSRRRPRRRAVHPHQRRRRHRLQGRHRAARLARARQLARPDPASRRASICSMSSSMPATWCGWSAPTRCPRSSSAISTTRRRARHRLR